MTKLNNKSSRNFASMDIIILKINVIYIPSVNKIYVSILIICLMNVWFVNNNQSKMELYVMNFHISLNVIGMRRLMFVKNVILILISKVNHLPNVYRYHKMNWYKDAFIIIPAKCVHNVMRTLIMRFLEELV